MHVSKKIQNLASELGIKLLKAQKGQDYRQAIHLRDPDDIRLEEALFDAEKDNFWAIIIHTTVVDMPRNKTHDLAINLNNIQQDINFLVSIEPDRLNVELTIESMIDKAFNKLKGDK